MENGFELVPGFIDVRTARELRALYDDDGLFRKRIVMERHTYGRGEYKYFANPLPAPIASLRETLYRRLLPVANAWMQALGTATVFPSAHQAFLDACFENEQKRPTPLLLRYGPGDYNRLHQDVYGPVAFPLQATLYLSRPGEDFGGGEVVLSETQARAQTRVHVLTPQQGDLLLFATRYAPRAGTRGTFKVTFKHGVATVAWGERFTLGMPFHDAL